MEGSFIVLFTFENITDNLYDLSSGNPQISHFALPFQEWRDQFRFRSLGETHAVSKAKCSVIIKIKPSAGFDQWLIQLEIGLGNESDVLRLDTGQWTYSSIS